MTTNQTIDGVPRGQLVRWEEMLRTPPGRQELLEELRALLDAPACKACNGTRLVSDGALHCSSGGIPFENGPIDCVKDCPCCTPAAKHQGEPVAWRGLNADGEVVTEWIDGIPPERMTDLCGNAASFDKIERAYAEQPAPVAASGNRTPFEIEHDAEPGDEAAFRQWRQERLNTARPAHANPPPGAEPCGTHHDNDGLDDYRNTK